MSDEVELTWFLEINAPLEVVRLSRSRWGVFCDLSCIYQGSRRQECDAWAARIAARRAEFQAEQAQQAAAAAAEKAARAAARAARREHRAALAARQLSLF